MDRTMKTQGVLRAWVFVATMAVGLFAPQLNASAADAEARGKVLHLGAFGLRPTFGGPAALIRE